MPRKTKNSSKTLSAKERRKKAAWGGYIRCELTPQERDEFPHWVDSNHEKLFALLDTLLRQEITVSMLLDEDNAAYVARLTCVLGDEPATWILTGFHGTVAEALWLVLFKHFVILDSDWTEFTGGGGGGFNWG